MAGWRRRHPHAQFHERPFLGCTRNPLTSGLWHLSAEPPQANEGSLHAPRSSAMKIERLCCQIRVSSSLSGAPAFVHVRCRAKELFKEELGFGGYRAPWVEAFDKIEAFVGRGETALRVESLDVVGVLVYA